LSQTQKAELQGFLHYFLNRKYLIIAAIPPQNKPFNGITQSVKSILKGFDNKKIIPF